MERKGGGWESLQGQCRSGPCVGERQGKRARQGASLIEASGQGSLHQAAGKALHQSHLLKESHPLEDCIRRPTVPIPWLRAASEKPGLGAKQWQSLEGAVGAGCRQYSPQQEMSSAMFKSPTLTLSRNVSVVHILLIHQH